ncbi:MAG: hypothetical protein COA36_13210 [Desulfotalea sp.]|nr:MAG: hypothetical protein COA36_13210 [Desulfotalea sp.]
MKPAAGKVARVKFYDKNGNYLGSKVFKDGRVVLAGAKIHQNAIAKAKDLLAGGLAFTGEVLDDLIDPFGAVAGELGADHMLCSDGSAPPCNEPCEEQL